MEIALHTSRLTWKHEARCSLERIQTLRSAAGGDLLPSSWMNLCFETQQRWNRIPDIQLLQVDEMDQHESPQFVGPPELTCETASVNFAVLCSHFPRG